VRRMGRIVGSNSTRKAAKIALVAGLDAGEYASGARPAFSAAEHDRGAMGVVGAHEMHGIAGQPPRAGPESPWM